MRNQKIRLLGAVAVGVVFVLALIFLPLKQWAGEFIDWVHGFGSVGAVIYGLAYALGTVLLIPGTALTGGAGLLYGTVIGTLIVSPASVVGATLSFIIARYFGRAWVEARLRKHPKFAAIDQAVSKSGFKVVLLLRLEPVFIPFALLNYGLGLTSIRLRDYVLASWLGMLPATILYVYLGSAVHKIGDLLDGKLPQSGVLGAVLFWSGLATAVILVFILGRIARNALHRELNDSATREGSVA
jgi:uncharacterized membrane protein YdjX (TVP38/TMEM64 family)